MTYPEASTVAMAMITGYQQAPDEPQLVRAPRTAFVSVSGAGAPATAVWHREKRLVTDIARQLATAGRAPDGQPAEHLQHHYLPSMPPTNIADFYSVNPFTELFSAQPIR